MEAEDPGNVRLLDLRGRARVHQEVSQPQDQRQELQLSPLQQTLRLWIQSQSSAEEGGKVSEIC